MSRRQVKQITHFVKNVKIVEFHDNIWNHREKYIKISTNIPSIGLVVHEIGTLNDFVVVKKGNFA